jgi:hypothetical protein
MLTNGWGIDAFTTGGETYGSLRTDPDDNILSAEMIEVQYE